MELQVSNINSDFSMAILKTIVTEHAKSGHICTNTCSEKGTLLGLHA